MNTKASLIDSIYGPAYILLLGMSIVIAAFIWAQISGQLSLLPMPQGISNQSIQDAISNADIAMGTFDYMVPFMVGGLMILSLIFAFRRGANVLYIGLALVFWILALIMSVIYTNVFESFQANFPSTMTSYPILAFIFTNLKFIVLGWVFLISVVMFTRSKKNDNEMASTEMVYNG